jgi:predicted nucleic acid-binding protein
VKAFLDTSVLVATFYADHEHHPPSIDLFLRFVKKDACCGAHSLAEVYATLTGMPGKRRRSAALPRRHPGAADAGRSR